MVSKIETAFNTLEPNITTPIPKELLCYRTRIHFHFRDSATVTILLIKYLSIWVRFLDNSDSIFLRPACIFLV